MVTVLNSSLFFFPLQMHRFLFCVCLIGTAWKGSLALWLPVGFGHQNAPARDRRREVSEI